MSYSRRQNTLMMSKYKKGKNLSLFTKLLKFLIFSPDSTKPAIAVTTLKITSL